MCVSHTANVRINASTLYAHLLLQTYILPEDRKPREPQVLALARVLASFSPLSQLSRPRILLHLAPGLGKTLLQAATRVALVAPALPCIRPYKLLVTVNDQTNLDEQAFCEIKAFVDRFKTKSKNGGGGMELPLGTKVVNPRDSRELRAFLDAANAGRLEGPLIICTTRVGQNALAGMERLQDASRVPG